jgi:anti-sigma factor ChrR (cupin superfamily)
MSSHYLDVANLPWTAVRPGIEQKILFEDRERGLCTALFRWAPGAELPEHEHVDIEQTYVLEGSLADHEGVCRAGDYVWRPAGSRHRAWSTDGCLLLAVFLKPNRFD